jgi:hypothetical protein
MRPITFEGLALAWVPLSLLLACSSKSAIATSGPASVTGDGPATGANVGVVQSAVLFTGDTMKDGGETPFTTIELMSTSPGVSCATLLSDGSGTVGAIQVLADRATLPGQTLLLNGPEATLDLYADSASTGDASTDASIDSGPGQFLTGITGTLTFANASDASGGLAGTFDATMVGTTVGTLHVTGTFTAPSCGAE